MKRDERGLAVGFVVFFAAIVGAALLYIMLDPAMTTIIDMTRSQTTSSAATEQIDLASNIWGLLLFFAMFVSLLFIIARSVFESKEVG